MVRVKEKSPQINTYTSKNGRACQMKGERVRVISPTPPTPQFVWPERGKMQVCDCILKTYIWRMQMVKSSSALALQIFYEEGNVFNRFLRPQGWCTWCALVGDTEFKNNGVYKKTPGQLKLIVALWKKYLGWYNHAQAQRGSSENSALKKALTPHRCLTSSKEIWRSRAALKRLT